jgi:hypothetical protein
LPVHRVRFAAIVDDEDQAGQIGQGVGQALVHEVIADAPSFGGGGDKAAAAETSEVVGDVRLAQPEKVGQLLGVVTAVEDPEEKASTRLVGQGPTNPAEGFKIDVDRGHTRIVQPLVNYRCSGSVA